MHPKNVGEDALPNLKPIADRQLGAILISHSHQDHIGTLPVLMRRQPNARVFMTETTAEIVNALLHNSVNVMTRQREEIGATLYPLFTHRETDRAADFWHSCPMRQRITISGERATERDTDALTFEFFDAGHILGSAGILLRAEGRTIFYTGDVNSNDHVSGNFSRGEDRHLDHGEHTGRSCQGRELDARRRRTASGRSNRWRLPARRMRAHSRFRARQNAGSARDALSIPPGKITDRFPDLYWRSQFEDDRDLRSSRARKPAQAAAPAIDGGSCAVRLKRSDHSGR